MSAEGAAGILRAEDLGKRFGDLVVLDGLSFAVERDQVSCLVGPTGCGKSTLLRLLVGLDKPDHGEVTLGLDPLKVGVVFQDDALLPWRSVAENVALPLQVRRCGRARRAELVDRVLERLDLSDLRDVSAADLSGGYRQRVSLARALVGDPQLLILDEPFGHLDPDSREAIEARLTAWAKERRASVVFVTHNIEEAVMLADRIHVMSPRPTTVKEVVEVPLQHPRSVDLPHFVELRRQVTDLIRWW